MTRTIALLVLLGTLAACSPAPAPEAPVAKAPANPTADRAPSLRASPAPAPEPDDATSSPGAADALATFTGYGDMAFGTAADAMEQAWGGELKIVGKAFNTDCYFMTPTWVKVPAELHFMIGEGRFARVGTESAKFAAPGGGRIGMDKAAIETLYAGRIEVQPHKYTDGEYLRIKDPAGGRGVLVFETDARGAEAAVTEWRVGVPPQVDYVEGCS